MHRRYQNIIQDTADPSTANNTYEIGQQWTNVTTGDTFVLRSQTYGVSATWCRITVPTEESMIPVEWGKDGATAPDAAEDITSGNSIDTVRKFDSSGSPSLNINWKVPSNLLTAAPAFKYRVHCVVSEATGPSSEAVQFKLSGYSVGDGDASDGTYGTAVASSKTAITAAQYVKLTTDWSAEVTITNLAAGEVAKLLFERDNTVGSNYGQKIAVVFIEFQYARS